MSKTWSDGLIEETREVLNLKFLPFSDFIYFKNINGGYGKISLDNLIAGKLIIQDSETDIETTYKFTTKSLRVLVITVIPAGMLESSHRDVFECKPSLASGLRQSLPQ